MTAVPEPRPTVLVAGMGNVLRGDDGFGIEVVRRLKADPALPKRARVIDVGIAGIPLVQELLDGYDTLIIVDAVNRGRPPGTVMTLRPELPDIDSPAPIGDSHAMTPSRVLLLARALGVLPREAFIVGCEPECVDELVMGLTERVAAAVETAVATVLTLVRDPSAPPAVS